MKSFDVGIVVWTMRRDHIGYSPYTPEKAHQCGGEIPSGRATHKTGVIVKGEHPRQAMLGEKLGPHLEKSFGSEIAAHFAVQPDRGACIDEVGNLDHLLLLPFWISRHKAFIFEVELNFLPWLSQI
jgi:hypothetical protein